jgi:hypothetical protein
MEPTYFKTQAEFRRWLKANYAKETECGSLSIRRDAARKAIT